VSALLEQAPPYEIWRQYFLANRERACLLEWDRSEPLSGAERLVVGRSIQQFQLGEYARGRGFLRRASRHPELGSQPEFVKSLELFIQEEQRHSSLLRDFLEHEHIPLLGGDAVDHVFRRLRKLAGLEVCVMVLVTAEVLAIPFYSALRGATNSRALKAICARILRDEAAHQKYQALTLGMIRRRLSRPGRAMRHVTHSALFKAAALVLWVQHRRVFRAARRDFHAFWKQAHACFRWLEAQAMHS
jgi:hypothetical protein